MKTDDLRESIVERLQETPGQALSATELSTALGLRGKDRKHLQKWLHELVLAGRIVCIRQNRYALGAAADLLTGIFNVARSGRAYLEIAGPGQGERISIPDLYAGTALPGDRVMVRLQDPLEDAAGGPRVVRRRTDPEARVGKVVRILERARHDIVGTLRSTGRFLYVEPLAPAYTHDLYVAEAAGARVGHRVVARFVHWQNRHVNPEGEIIEVLGPADDPSVDTISVIREYNLRETFPHEVLREAEHASAAVDAPGERLDLRDRFVFTIDPARARDFDDALSLERDAAGRRVLGVHIADVSHFVRVGTALDREARERGNSVYLVDAVLPMLPEQLSNGVCSLNPHADRLAFSVFMTVDDRGEVVGRAFARSLIRSRLRLTYEQAMALLQGGDPAAAGTDAAGVALLREVDTLARQWRRRRFARFALDLDIPECEILLNPGGALAGVRVVPYDESHQLIEECMVAANETVAAELADRGCPLISRLHDPPSPQALERLTGDLEALGYRPGDLAQPRNLSAFLASVKDDPLAEHVRVAVLRSMSRAVYSAARTGHYGLSKHFYCHFTSPIRRYPDLVVHRQLAAVLAGATPRPYDLDALHPIATGCTLAEQTADQAERDLVEIKKLRYLQEQLDRGEPVTTDAVVVRVENFGMFVEVDGLQLQGLVHVSAISDRFVRYGRSRRTLRAGRDTYRIGRRVRVRVSKVDFPARRVDFVLA